MSEAREAENKSEDVAAEHRAVIYRFGVKQGDWP